MRRGKTSARFTNLIAEPDAAEDVVVDAVNDTLKAIAASLLMEQVLAPRFNFTPKNAEAARRKVSITAKVAMTRRAQHRLQRRDRTVPHRDQGLVTPKSPEATRICQEDLNEVITAFVQDKTAIERGLFDEEPLPEELTQVRMGKIVRDRYPDLSETDQEAIRQHAIAALNLTQKAKAIAVGRQDDDDELKANTAFVDGVRKFAMDVRELDIDLIDSINPFEAAYAVLAKTMNEEILQQVAAAIAGQAHQPHARGSARAGQARRQIQAGARAACLPSRLPTPGRSGWRKVWHRSHDIRQQAPMADLTDDDILNELGTR